MTTAIRPAPARIGVAGTALAHGTLVGLALLAAHRAKPSMNIVYEVNLVAAPLPSPAVRIAAPEATPAAPEEVAPPVVKPRVIKAVRKPPPAPSKRVDVAPVTKSPTPPAPGEQPSTGRDVVTLHQAGISFPYPEYLNNIENKIFAQWNHAMFRPGLDVKIGFVILRDGSVNMSSVEIDRSSGNSSFDLNARAAIEAAANARAFGPLPSGFSGGSLPILFDFTQIARGAP